MSYEVMKTVVSVAFFVVVAIEVGINIAKKKKKDDDK